MVPEVATREVVSFPSGLGGTLELASDLAPSVARLRADCMARQGREEIRRSLELARPANPDFVRDPLSVELVEFGPSTQGEATRYGMAGTELVADLGDSGGLISKDADFDRHSEGCDEWIGSTVAPGVWELQSRAAAFSDTVNADFISALGDRLGEAMRDRVQCVREAGYSRLTPDEFLEAESMLAILDHAGVAPGRLDDTGDRIPDERTVPTGSVLVFPPPPAKSYQPSDEEVAFARAFVRCGEETGFPGAVREAVQHARAIVEERHAETGTSLRQDLDQVHRSLNGRA